MGLAEHSNQSAPGDLAGKRVFVAGHAGMLGAALVRRLVGEGCEVLTAARSRLDLRDQQAVRTWLGEQRPDVVVDAAARVGGVGAHSAHPADYLYDNLITTANLIEASHAANVQRLLYVASSAIYPADAPVPIAETSLLTGPLDESHKAYAVAKIAGLALCAAYHQQHGRHYFSVAPANLYGPGARFDPATSQVIPAMIRKAHEAKLRGDTQIELWGSGEARREFLFVDDCADACVLLLGRGEAPGPVNIGSGQDICIADLADLVCRCVGFAGAIRWNAQRPEGVKRRLVSSDRLRALGWAPSVPLEEGVARTYAWYVGRPLPDDEHRDRSDTSCAS